MSEQDSTYDAEAHFNAVYHDRLALRLGRAAMEAEALQLRGEFTASERDTARREAAAASAGLESIRTEVDALRAALDAGDDAALQGAGSQGLTSADAPLGTGGDVGDLGPLDPPDGAAGDQVTDLEPLPPPVRVGKGAPRNLA